MRVSSLLVIAAALSAGLPVAASASGAYGGLFVGYVDLNPTARDGSSEPVSYSADGAIGGGLLGYEWNVGRYSLGLVADIAADSAGGMSYDSSGPVIFKIDQQWDASLRARVAYPMPGFTPYLTAGVAYAEFESKYSQVGLPFYVTNFDRTGWTLGAGASIPMSGAFSASVEYRYSDFGSDGGGPDGPYDLTTHRVTLGVNYGF